MYANRTGPLLRELCHSHSALLSAHVYVSLCPHERCLYFKLCDRYFHCCVLKPSEGSMWQSTQSWDGQWHLPGCTLGEGQNATLVLFSVSGRACLGSVEPPGTSGDDSSLSTCISRHVATPEQLRNCAWDQRGPWLVNSLIS